MRSCKTIFLSLVFLLLAGTTIFSQEIKWYNWEEGYKKATKEKKIVLLDAYTEWCGWCKVMDRDTYTEKNVQSKIANKYIPIKLNPEHKGAYVYNDVSYTGRELIQKLSMNKFRGFPSTFFVFPESGKSFMEVGYIKAEPFNKLLDKYVEIK